MKADIIGATGATGKALLAQLLDHPQFDEIGGVLKCMLINGGQTKSNGDTVYLRCGSSKYHLLSPLPWAEYIAIHRKPHTVLRRLAVQMRTVFGDAPCLKLSVDGYKAKRQIRQ